ncbi:hydrolase [Hyphodiscus hymeniophilus]|uniref:Hydrolase n=1 Tax=Hyphodiscus hymeniophilus TaxID=353542 RepID=A0A9P6VPA1_9HELO|nr:hydrolase [Hyphodiscus hymeniophilus]
MEFDSKQSQRERRNWRTSSARSISLNLTLAAIEPAKGLIWHRCYEEYDCARLNVPLDWLDPSEELRASIAVIRYNATDKKNYKGPVFINPGGPGGSGVWFMKRLAPYYQAVIGRNHDIISFDPRGVGQTVPRIDCWKSSQSGRIWNLQETPVLDAHPGAVYDAYAHTSAFSQQCALQIGGDRSSNSIEEAGTGRFVSTASTARDMLEIMEKAGQDKLKYWGFSYGTILGTTFAAMFPDRIERMVNDGNVDAAQYFSGSGSHYLHDTDKVMEAFYHFCHIAGPSSCTFHASSSLSIQSRLESLLQSLKKSPVIVLPSLNSTDEIPIIISYSDVRRLIASSLYRPLVMFPRLAEALTAIEAGDGNAFLDVVGRNEGNSLLCDDGKNTPTPELPEVEGSADASKAILCSEQPLQNDTVDTFSKYVEEAAAISKAAGATMADIHLGCVGWKVEAKWRFTGPFQGNTSHPILFVSNIADNITPLVSARLNAKGFPGSVVLVSNSYGHTSLSTPSQCTAKHIQRYFQHGVLPQEDTVCDPDLVPFERWNMSASWIEDELGVALRELMLAPVVGMGM